MFMIDPGAESLYSFFDLSPDATPAEIRGARDRLTKQLRMKIKATADPEEKKALEARNAEVNSKAGVLTAAKSRAEYDDKHAGLIVFCVKVAASPLFHDMADQLYVLYESARRFLAEKGQPLPALCDLDRVDFTSDHSPCELLDGLLKEASNG